MQMRCEGTKTILTVEKSICIIIKMKCDWNRNLVHINPNFTGRTQDNNMFKSSASNCIRVAMLVHNAGSEPVDHPFQGYI